MGLAARQALGRSSWFGIAYAKNQLSGFQGIKFPWKPTLSGSIEYHGPPMFKLVLEKAEEPEIKLPTSPGSWKKEESPEKHLI